MPTARRARIAPTLAPAPVITGQLPTLAAPRLQLRWIHDSDLDDLYGVLSDPDVTRYWSHQAWSGPDEAPIYFETLQQGFLRGDLFQWGIALRGDDRLIGTATLCDIDLVQGRAELGFALARDHWGRRYGREALTVLLEYAFGTLGLRRIEADVDPRNLPSLRTLEGLGFLREGYLRQRWQVGGELQDSVLMGLLASDWPAAP
ncbi:GNAT family protein [Arenimonas alkanexedens]